MAIKAKRPVFLWLAGIIVLLTSLALHYLLDSWGFYWKVSPEDAQLRMSLVEAAEGYLGLHEGDEAFQTLIREYNAQSNLPMDYPLTPEDSWCAAFVTVAALQAGLTDIIPPECSCERQIGLFLELERWEERDSLIPLPGDLIYYDFDNRRPGDCTGWSDHVGIVVGTKWPFIKVIEGNWSDQVCYRYILINDISIRGFGKPDYTSLIPDIMILPSSLEDGSFLYFILFLK